MMTCDLTCLDFVWRGLLVVSVTSSIMLAILLTAWLLFKRKIDSDEIKTAIETDVKEFQNFKLTGTPTFILNGVVMGGAQSPEDFERVANLTLKSN